MKNIIYSKYNTHRAVAFRIRTSVVVEDGKKYILKTPISKEAVAHVASMKENRKLLLDAYNNIVPVKYTEDGNGLRFDFINGKPLSEALDFGMGVERNIPVIKSLLAIVLDYKKECIKDGRVSPANIDSNFSNFIKTKDGLILVDYEWVENEPVELGFLKYRILRYTYMENAKEISEEMSFEDFMAHFGFKESHLYRYGRMEYAFADYVHGKRQQFIYDGVYEKPDRKLEITSGEKIDVNSLYEQLAAKESEVNALRAGIEEREIQKVLLNNEIVKRQEKLDKIKSYIKNPALGAVAVAKRAKRKLVPANIVNNLTPEMVEQERQKSLLDYQGWIEQTEALDANTDYEKEMETWKDKPLISIIAPVYNCDDKYLIACIDSVRSQIYKNWELILYDDDSTLESVKTTLEDAAGSDSRIKAYFAKENGGISAASNLAIEKANGEFIAFLDSDDLLSPNALFEMVKLYNSDDSLDLIYSDEDKIDDAGKIRFEPNFKPDFAPDTLLNIMYTCHFSMYRKSVIEKIGGLNSEFDGAQDHDLALRFTEETKRVGHVKKILYHWRKRDGSTAEKPDAKPYAALAEIKVKEAAIKRRNLKAYVSDVEDTATSRIVYETPGFPLVSIIIPSKDHPDVLRRAVDSLVRNTTYRNYEIILVDNGSSGENQKDYRDICLFYDIDYVYDKYDFNFSKMCNQGAAKAEGKYLLFLNDDIEVPAGRANWLSLMVGQAMQSATGAVGAKLYYPGGKIIQHCGVTNILPGPGHICAGMDDGIPSKSLFNRVDMNCLAVTAAALMVGRDKFEKIGGFNEELSVSYNDVDLCIKLYKEGFLNILRNDVILIHHESLSRGDDTKDSEKMERLGRERNKLYSMHPEFSHGEDPYRSPFYNRLYADDSFNVFTTAEMSLKSTAKKYSTAKESDVYRDELVLDMGGHIAIAGFAIFLKDGDDGAYDVLITNGNKSYTVRAERVFSERFLGEYGWVPNVSTADYRTYFSKKHLTPGEYSLYIVHNEKKYPMNKTIKVAP